MRLVRMVGEQDEAAGREARPVVLFNPRMSRRVRECMGMILDDPGCIGLIAVGPVTEHPRASTCQMTKVSDVPKSVPTYLPQW